MPGDVGIRLVVARLALSDGELGGGLAGACRRARQPWARALTQAENVVRDAEGRNHAAAVPVRHNQPA